MTSFSNFRLNIGAVLTDGMFMVFILLLTVTLWSDIIGRKKVQRQNKMSTRTIDECSETVKGDIISKECTTVSSLHTCKFSNCSFTSIQPYLISILENMSLQNNLGLFHQPHAHEPLLLRIYFNQSNSFERTWWRLFQKCVMHTNYNIYVLIRNRQVF